MSMPGLVESLSDRKAIVDRRALVEAIETAAQDLHGDALRARLLDILKTAYKAGIAEIRKRLEAREIRGRQCAGAISYLMDQLLRVLFDATTTHVFPLSNPTESERLALVATGGYGRGLLAPHSDIDILFLLPYKATPWAEQVAEFMLYMLWDLGLKVGHATRSIDDCLRLARGDLTIKTALLEARYLWGDEALYKEMHARFRKEVVAGTGAEFVEQKLAERDARHQRMGDSRYVVEPNLKEGKGGLRDVQTLFWIGKYVYNLDQAAGMVTNGVFTPLEFQRFRAASDFLWMVRCHLHFLARRGEERLTFDVQPELARRLRYRDTEGLTGVERFMKHYFLIVKRVGDLTRVFCASLEEQHQKRSFFRLPALATRRKQDGFLLENGRLTFPKGANLAQTPVEMLRIFQVAGRLGRDIHPDALRLMTRHLKEITAAVRNDPAANAIFLDILTSPESAESTLRLMNEAGVFGRFVPDFGRVVAQTQHDMYHHYTVDEHTIRAIGLLGKVERGDLKEDHPVISEVIHKLISRRVLYVAVLLHDIAKGRRGDHSVLGAEIALELSPRFGLTHAETETVSWLVRQHLLMTQYAFKRDINDPVTVLDFARQVQSPERLKLLIALTVVDIRAVGPGIWNGWKGQLLRDLYYAAEEVLMLGHMKMRREERVTRACDDLRGRLSDWSDKQFAKYVKRFQDSYWIAETLDTHERNARQMAAADAAGLVISVATHVNIFEARTEVTVYSEDHAGLFARVTGALSVAGASIVDAKIFTTRDGMALDNFQIQGANGLAFDNPGKLKQLEQIIVDTLKGKLKPRDRLNKSTLLKKREEVFTVAPVVLIDNAASNRFTVIEINAKDRNGLLFDLTEALFHLKISISSAHVATYGERAVDVFYVTDLIGQKLTNKLRLKNIEAKLLSAARGERGPVEPGADMAPQSAA